MKYNFNSILLSFFFLIFILLFILPASLALNPTAKLVVKNNAPEIISLNLLNFREQPVISVKIMDKNGYEDIKQVKVDIIAFESKSSYLLDEIIIPQSNIIINSKLDVNYIYNYSKILNSGEYQFVVNVTDGKSEAERTFNITIPEKENNLITGSFTRVFENTFLKDKIIYYYNRLKMVFR